jgi:hypothetical protein
MQYRKICQKSLQILLMIFAGLAVTFRVFLSQQGRKNDKAMAGTV